eukprot:GHVQ01010065.1.p1 GENE.GHVQ01010065.1~~GHVQ01010065.1.p1  ORF type:complete len:574 (+),score=68.39 GHVQ01010065.1:316-2037(+)
MSRKFESISLGQGQGPKAQRLIHDGCVRGGWVLLQNCHLAASWMGELERICEQLRPDEVHRDFRLWLTSIPSKTFPVSVLQNGVKMTNEPPKGLRANLMRSFMAIDDKLLEDCQKPDAFRRLLFGFCFFHAIVQDRRKFGPIGWNIPYEFTTEDLTVCRRQLKIFLDAYETVPHKVLNFLGAQINYGGRVTDDKDKRLISCILKTYITDEVIQQGSAYKFSSSGKYYCPNATRQEEFVEYIETLPHIPSPEVFGLHENANITFAQTETTHLLEGILCMEPRCSSGHGTGREDALIEAVEHLEERRPELFDMDFIQSKYPTAYDESMNTVLVQECIRYNRLLIIIRTSLAEIKKAIKGLVVMSDELETMSNSIYDNQVPQMWASRGFLSLKPLSSWIKELNERIVFFKLWIDTGTPSNFWISGLFFPQAFLTGTLQNYARRHFVAIDRVSFRYKVMDNISQEAEITDKPIDGCYVYGIYLEGCKWDKQTHELTLSSPKVLYDELPPIWLQPEVDQPQQTEGVYTCPVYKVMSRAGSLSTTGHSTNFVMSMALPSSEKEDVWTKAGVAGFLSLRY